MKYIIDLDALKGCFELLPIPIIKDGEELVKLNDVINMINRFPKDSYEELNVKTETRYTSSNENILNGKGLKPLNNFTYTHVDVNKLIKKEI